LYFLRARQCGCILLWCLSSHVQNFPMAWVFVHFLPQIIPFSIITPWLCRFFIEPESQRKKFRLSNSGRWPELGSPDYWRYNSPEKKVPLPFKIRLCHFIFQFVTCQHLFASDVLPNQLLQHISSKKI
jgi:hypothetical protein